ncbi:MAG: FHA domain-containing protein [Planctomycetota bacterium]
MTLAELRFLEGDQPPIELFPGPLVIGRDASCDRVIQHEKVSKRHAEIWRDRDHCWYVRDLGSSNGTQVERKRITEPTRLVSGATVHIGAVGFRFHADAVPAPARATPGVSAPRSRRAAGAKEAGAGGVADASPRAPLPRRSELARLAWGLVVVLLCVYAGLQAWRFYGPGAQPERAEPSGMTASRVSDPTTAPGVVPPAVSDTAGVARTAGSGSAGATSDLGVEPARDGTDPALSTGSSPAAETPAGAGAAVSAPDSAAHDAGQGAAPESTNDAAHAGTARTGSGADPTGATGGSDEPERTQGDPQPDRINPNRPRAVEPRSPAGPTSRESGAAGGVDGVDPPAVPPAPVDPVLDALARRDFGALARHLASTPESPHRAQIHALLTTAPIVALERNGLLGAPAEAQLSSLLARAYPRRCTPDDALALARLPFSTPVVRRSLRIRFQHDYQTGLGRLVGKTRLAPHPKQVEIELVAPGDGASRNKVLGRTEGKTPWIAPDQLSAGGLTEEEVWQMTLAPLLAALDPIFTRDAREITP